MTEFPDFSLAGKVALVTASGRGLGRAIAIALAHAGADIALGLRDRESAGDVAETITAMGRRAVPLQMNMTSLPEIRQAIADAHEAFGRLDILVNNAGIAPDAPATEVTEENFDATLRVNLKGTFFASQAAANIMSGQGSGASSTSARRPDLVALPGESIYCMTKAAIGHLTKCLAVEWGVLGITVNCVAPTFIETPGTEPALSDPAFRADVIERIAALHRIGQPVDVTGAVVFLASDAASFITGTTIPVDGGWTAR